MKCNLLFLLIALLGLSTFVNCAGFQKCPEGINLLPMYGNVEKCKGQLEADEQFLKESDEREPDRSVASINYLEAARYYFMQEDYDTAIKRVNQAWLLDSTTVMIYPFFVVILDITDKPYEAMEMIDITLDKIKNRENPETPTEMDPTNEMLIGFIVENVLYAYEKTNNPVLAEYLYRKLDSLDISEVYKEVFKTSLEKDIPVLI